MNYSTLVFNRNIKIKRDIFQTIIDLFLIFLLGVALFFFKDKTGDLNKVGIIILIFIALSKLENNIYYLFLFMPYYMLLLIKGFQLYNLIIISFIIKYLLKNINKINLKAFILPILIFLFELFHSINKGFSLDMIKWIITCYAFSLLLLNPIKNLDIEKCVRYFTMGMFILSLSVIYFNTGEVIDDYSRNHITGIAFIEKNTYAIYCCVALMSILYLLKFKFRKKYIYIIPFISILLSAVLMISKTFLLIFSISLLLFIIMNLKKFKSVIIIFIVIVLASIIVLSNQYLIGIIGSYIDRFNQADNFDELTTGRWGIFLEYGNYLLHNGKAFIIGEGLFSYMRIVESSFVLQFRPHNLELELLISWGIIGTTSVVFLVIQYYRNAKRFLNLKKNSAIAMLPLFSLIMGLQAITLIYQNITMMIFIYCFYIMLFNLRKERCI